MKILVEKIFVFYVGLSVVVCNLLPIPELIKGFLAMFSFLIIPYLVGNAFFQVKFFRKRFIEIDTISYSFLTWSFGVIVIVLSLTSLYPLHLLNAKLYSFTLFLILIVYYFFYFLYKPANKIYETDKQKDKKISRQINKCYINKKIGVILLLVCTIYSLFLSFFSPFPLWFDPDVFVIHNREAWLLTDYGELTISPFYINILGIISGIVSILFNVDPYPFQWMCARLLFPAILVFGLYFFLSLFVDKKLAIIGAFVGLWSIHQVYISAPLLTMFIPLVVSFLLIPFAFFFVERNIVPYLSENKLNIKTIFFLFVFAIISIGVLWISIEEGPEIGPFIYLYILLYFIFVLILLMLILLSNKNLRFCCFSLFIVLSAILFVHNFVGLSMAVAIIVYMFFTYIYLKYTEKAKLLMLFIIGLFVLFVIMQNYKIIDIQREYFVPHSPSPLHHLFYPILDFDDKLNLLMKQYPIIIILLLFLGITNIMLNSMRLYALVTLFIIYVGIILFALDFEIYRLIHIIHVLVALFLLYGIIEVLRYFKFNVLKNFIILFIFVALFFSMFHLITLTIKNYSDWLGGNYSSISLEEYSAGKWMKKHISKNTLIISDWTTGNAVSSISHIKMIPHHQITKRKVADAISSNNTEEIYYKIKNITGNKWFIKRYAIDSKDPLKPYGLQAYHKDWIEMQTNTTSTIVVVSARTIAWANSKYPELPYPTWLKMNEHYKKCLAVRFFNETYFTPLYNNEEIYIFGVNPEPGVPFKIQNDSK